MKRVIVFNVGDHDSGGPSGVCSQSSARMSAPISPPPTSQSGLDSAGVTLLLIKRAQGNTARRGFGGCLGNINNLEGRGLLQHGRSLGSKSSLIDFECFAGGAFPGEPGGMMDARA